MVNLRIVQPHNPKEPLSVRIKNNSNVELTMPEAVIEMKEDLIKAPMFFKFKRDLTTGGSKEIELEVYNPETKQILKTLPLKLIGPIK